MSSHSVNHSGAVTPSRALIAFSLGAMFFLYAFMQRVAPSIMTTELMRDFSVGATALGSLSAFYFYAYASIQLPVGMLTDRFGPRKLMSGAAAMCAIATIGFAMSDSLWVASLSRAMIGATVAFGFVGTLAIIGYWFKPAQFAMLTGVVQTMGMCGGIFGQAPLRLVVESLGWRGMMGILASLAILLAILIYLLVPRRSTEQKNEQRKGIEPVGILGGLKKVTANPQSWICALVGFGMASTMLSFGGLWAVPWLSSVHGYTTTQAAGMASMLFVAWAIFAPIVGWASDRIGRRNPIMVIGAIIYLVAFSFITFATPDSTTMLVILIFITGMGGSSMTICFTVVKEHNASDSSSTAVGLMNMFVVGSGAVMQPLIGWLLDLRWAGTVVDGARLYSADAYTFAFTSLVIVTAAALAGILVLRETFCRQVG